eukprot:8389029-Alexandrium_andersonii.AAC.1
MSASLVGSEMCIRDRFREWSAGRFRTTHCCSLCALPVWPRPLDHPPAVSYTHLTLPTICSV